MKRILPAFIFILLFNPASFGQSFYGSQYFVGTPINDSIVSTPISDPGPGGCYPSSSYTVAFPVSKVTGVTNYMLITAVSPGNSAYTTQLGQLHVGDTLPFNTTYPDYNFYFPTGGGIMYEIRAKGTPKVAGESYPCGQFIETTNASGCPDVISYTFIQTGKVQASNGSVSPMAFKIEPLVNLTASSYSSTNTVKIDASITLKSARFELYDAFGRRVASQTVSDKVFTINRDNIPNGDYFWKMINNEETIGLGKVIITQ